MRNFYIGTIILDSVGIINMMALLYISMQVTLKLSSMITDK